MRKKFILVTMFLPLAGFAQNPFPELLENFYDPAGNPSEPNEVVLPPSPIKYDVLFTGGVDYVHNKLGDSALAKEWHDFTGYIPIDGRSDSGYVVINHERIQSDPVNGDGGGMTVFTAWYDRQTMAWKVSTDSKGKYRNVYFTPVGGTAANCGGVQTNWGKVFTAEEWEGAFGSNKAIHNNGAGIQDTSDFLVQTFNGASVNRSIKRHMNYCYMVEVDVEQAKAVRKQYNMGRYAHEGGWVASDDKTMYLTDDKSSGSVLYKFVADSAKDFSVGKLYTYQQFIDGDGGTWLEMPMKLDSMLHARDVALHMGATVFMRLEWIEGINDQTIFITETGRGKTVDVSEALRAGGTLANHLVEMDAADGAIDSIFTDIYGRILRLNVTSSQVEVALEGGGNLRRNYNPSKNHMSPPDGLVSTVIKGKTYLSINEDMNPKGLLGSPVHFSSKLNEAYILDVSDDAPGMKYQIKDLTRFIAGPAGCETTGGRFTSDGTTYFVNIQHPSASNVPPFNHSVTLTITGYKDVVTTNIDEELEKLQGDSFGVYPNPVSRMLHLTERMDFAIYDLQGKRQLVRRNAKVVDLSGLSSGRQQSLGRSVLNKNAETA